MTLPCKLPRNIHDPYQRFTPTPRPPDRSTLLITLAPIVAAVADQACRAAGRGLPLPLMRR